MNINNSTTKPYKDIKFIWVSDHYDIHLSGLCRENKELCRFSTDYDSLICTIYSLTFFEKIKWLIRKFIFEICVGCHWSYPLGRTFKIKTPQWFWMLVFNYYYKKNRFLKK